MEFICASCGKFGEKDASAVNRATSIGAKLFCNRVCFGLSRRRSPDVTTDQLKAAKREYDAKRRAEKGEELLEKRRDYYHSNRQAILASMAVYRKKHMARHVEYCRQPTYKAKKQDYDKKRNEMEYGEFAETWRLLQQVEAEIRSQASAYEVRVQQGYYTRNAQKRRRELWQQKQKT